MVALGPYMVLNDTIILTLRDNGVVTSFSEVHIYPDLPKLLQQSWANHSLMIRIKDFNRVVHWHFNCRWYVLSLQHLSSLSLTHQYISHAWIDQVQAGEFSLCWSPQDLFYKPFKPLAVSIIFSSLKLPLIMLMFLPCLL